MCKKNNYLLKLDKNHNIFFEAFMATLKKQQQQQAVVRKFKQFITETFES